MLVDRSTGIPLFNVSIYALSDLRLRNLATNTILLK